MPKPTSIELKIPSLTLLKVAVAVGLVAAVMELAPFLLVILLAILIAVTLSPIVEWFEKHASRRAGILLIVFAMVCFLTALFVFVLPSIVDQISGFIGNWPKYRAQLLEQVPTGSMFRGPLEKILQSELTQSKWVERFVLASGAIVNGVIGVLLLLVISVYLLADGPRVYRWGLAFFSPANRAKIEETGNDISKIVFAYVAGQFITSALVFFITLIVMTWLGVPAAMTLAVLAGIMDVLPVLGFFLSAGPALLLGLTVSPQTGLIVLGYFVFYHLIENYFIIPQVYGNRLRLSTLSVLLSLLVAGLLAGILGAIAVLPIVASFHVIERIWLAPLLGASTVDKHVEQLKRE